MPAVGLFAEVDPDMPSVVPPVVAVPHGRPLVPTRPELPEFDMLPGVLVLEGLLEPVELAAALGFEVVGLMALGFIVPWLMALGFDALGLGLPGVVAVLPAAVPVVAPAPPAPVAAPPAPPLCAKTRPVPLRRTTVASKANRYRLCGISDSLCGRPLLPR